MKLTLDELRPLRLTEEVEPLHGDRRHDKIPYYPQKENARHRTIIELKATGKYTNKEIAALVEMSPITVNYVLRQPWAEKMLVELIRKEGRSEREAVFQLLDGVTIEAVEKQIEILRQPVTKDTQEVIRKASNDILNRSYGTPTQKVEMSKADNIAKMSDAEIAERLADLRARRAN